MDPDQVVGFQQRPRWPALLASLQRLPPAHKYTAPAVRRRIEKDAKVRLRLAGVVRAGEELEAGVDGQCRRVLEPTRFMHEMLTAPPTGAPKVTKAIKKREKTFKPKYGKAPTPASRSEDFYPKHKRGLADLTASYKAASQTISWQGGKPWPPQYVLLRMAILLAADLPATDGSNLRTLYAANQAMFDRSAAQLETLPDANQLHAYLLTTSLSRAMAAAASTNLFDQFKTAASDYADAQILAAHAARPGGGPPATIATLWHPADTDYDPDPTSPTMQAERERDLSMFEHIQQARAAGHLVYGYGGLHEKRLAELLDHEGIRHSTVDDFIDAQKALYPQ
jgi:hypothetical protein